MEDVAADFAKELEELVAEPGPQQASASAAAQPNEPNTIDPVFQADAWGQYTREQRLAYMQAQLDQPPGRRFPQRPQQSQNQLFIGATHGVQQGQQGWPLYQVPVGGHGVAPQVIPQQLFGPMRWPPPADAAPAVMPGLASQQVPLPSEEAPAVMPGLAHQWATQAQTRSPAPQHEPGRVVLSDVPGSEIEGDLLRRMIGPDPMNVDSPQVNQFYNYDRGDKDPVPKWNGSNIAKMLKPWCRDLRLWRAETSVPRNKHGLKLFRSFEAGSWLKSAADRVPEEMLVTGDAWRLIMMEILKVCKPYLDCLLYTSPSPRDLSTSRMPSSA